MYIRPAIPHEGKVNNFNLLRLVLATLVLLSHSFEMLDGSRVREPLTRLFGTISLGELAVDGFFIISGYLITQSWLRQPNPWHYLRKRLARLYPAFLVAGLICGLLAAPLLAGWRDYYKYTNWPAFLIQLLILRYQGLLLRLGDGGFQFNAAVWTIRYEMWCYLILLGMGMLGALKRLPVAICLVGIMGIFVSQTITAIQPPLLSPLPVPQLLVRFLQFFLAGTLAFLCHDQIRFTRQGAALAFIVILVSLKIPLWGEPLLAISGTYLLLAAAFAHIPILEPFQRFDDISYGTYLYGWPIQFTLAFHWPQTHPLAHFAISTILAYTCGFVSWHLVEKYFLSRHQQRRKHAQGAEICP